MGIDWQPTSATFCESTSMCLLRFSHSASEAVCSSEALVSTLLFRLARAASFSVLATAINWRNGTGAHEVQSVVHVGPAEQVLRRGESWESVLAEPGVYL
jgi:hypothetical protein